jgi:hypothetical protein
MAANVQTAEDLPETASPLLDSLLGPGLKGHGQDFIDAGAKYGVDPVLLASMSQFETGGGTSHVFKSLNNTAGLTGPGHSGVNGDYMPYDSPRESIFAQAAQVATDQQKHGLKTIEQLGSDPNHGWAPGGGVANDPGKTNETWPEEVTKEYNRIKHGLGGAPYPASGSVPKMNRPSSGDLEVPQNEPLPETATPFYSQPKRRAGPVPGTAVVDPLTEDEVQQEEQSAQNAAPEDQEQAYDDAQQRILSAHSARLTPDDQRVSLRVNPDTGSERLVGGYFVPGDPVNERLLSNYGPEDRAKLPWISQGIQSGQPLNFNYVSAEQEGGAPEWEGERTTGESRAYEQKVSTAQQRVEGEHEGQEDQKTIIPIQMVAGMPRLNQPPTVGLEGFGSQSVINNAGHLISGAKLADIKIPYQSTQDPKLSQDISGYLENQAHGYRGDGSSPALDETGQPNRLWQTEQTKPVKYVPHLLNKHEAHFVHAALNIVPGKKKSEPGKAPSFGERAEWLRRTMEGFEGDKIGPNPLREELDRKLPKVGRRSKVIDKKTGKPKILGYDPWTKGTLEPTWRRYRLELIKHEAPEAGAPSMREAAPMVHRAPQFRHSAAEHLPPAPLSNPKIGPAPLSQDPAIGAPIGEKQGTPDSGLLEGEAAEQEQESPVVQPAEPEKVNVAGHELPGNLDGTVTLYHATKSRESAERIVKEKKLRSAAEPSVYLSTANSGTGYGDHVVGVRVYPRHLELDDEFPDGRADFRIDKKEVRVADAWHHEPPIFNLPDPLAMDPAIGSYTDVPDEQITHAAVRYHPGLKNVYIGINHLHAHDNAAVFGERYPVDEGYLTNQGRYLTKDDLAAIQLRETGAAPQTPPQPPTPAQEAVQQPPLPKQKKTSTKSPTKGTPAELAAQAVQPQQPEGNF